MKRIVESSRPNPGPMTTLLEPSMKGRAVSAAISEMIPPASSRITHVNSWLAFKTAW